MPFHYRHGAACAVISVILGSQTMAHAQDSTAITLDPIVVTPNLTPTPIADVGSAVTVITGEELRRRQVRFVADALREVPGVAVNRSGPVGKQTQVRIRGSESNHTLVLIDGIRANDPSGAAEFDFGTLLANDIERIEVLRGPQSALYGSDAVGGVINIITRKGSGKPGVSAQIEGGSNRTVSGNASLSGGGERYNYLVSGSLFSTHGISAANERRGNAEADGYRNATGFAKFGFSPTDWFEASLIGRYTDRFNKTDDFFGGVGAVDGDYDEKGKQFFGRAEGKIKTPGGRWEHIFGASYTNQDTDYRSQKQFLSRFAGTTQRLDYQTNLRLDTPDFLNARHVLTAAVQYAHEGVVAESAFMNLDRHVRSTGLIGQYQGQFFDRLSVTASIRRDFNELFADATTWRITGAYRIEETGTKLRASFGTGVKNPTLFELYGYTQLYQGNPNLKPEQGRGWDIGIDQTLSDRLSADATYFDQQISDLIVGSGQTSVNVPGTSSITGVELGLTAAITPALDIRAAYTYTDARDAGGTTLPRRPRHTASLNANYRFADQKTALNLGVIANGSQKDLFFDAFFNQVPVTVPAYAVVNVGLSHQLTDAVQIYGRIENLFNKRYEEVFTYGSLGRTAYVGVRGRF